MGNIYVSLIHYPVYNKHRDIVTTAVTNFDIHDIARSCSTYGVSRYYLVHPVFEQVQMVKRLADHWVTGYGATFNSDRSLALQGLAVTSTFDEVTNQIKLHHGVEPKCIFTTARKQENSISYVSMRDIINHSNTPYLLVFGTGHGLIESFMQKADYVLDPIYGVGDYNHLCVRGAVSIILDRLFGT